MDPQIVFNLDEFSRSLGQLQLATQRSVADLLRQQAKLLVRDLIKMTPPFGKGRTAESFGSQRRIGQGAVERDIRRTFIDANKLGGNDSKLGQRIATVVRSGDVAAMRAIAKNLNIRFADVLAKPTDEAHQSVRDSGGRVAKGMRRWIVLGGIDAFVRRKQRDVGKFKSGWAMAAKALGLTLPPWIKNHGKRGMIKDQLDEPDPKITVGNLADMGANFHEDIVAQAIELRAESMRRQAEMVLKANLRKHGAPVQ